MNISKEQICPSAEQYKWEGEEYRFFSYGFKEGGQWYQTAYYFPRKKGAAQVTGFLVLDQEGHAVERDIAVGINRAFNRFNFLFKRFQGEWGDVVEQDVRKFRAVMEHFQALEPFQPEESKVKEWVDQIRQAVETVLACQDRFLQLDLQAIDLGRKRREQGYIDPALDHEVEQIILQFEKAVYEQVAAQYEVIPIYQRLAAYLREGELDRKWKKHLKRVKRIVSKMRKQALRHEERLRERRQDPENRRLYERLYTEWERLLRNPAEIEGRE